VGQHQTQPLLGDLPAGRSVTMAKQAFDQGDADTAKKKFKELIERYPKSERADNAQFWIGEIYYREKWYEKAILEYQKVIENYPKGNKVPASLLKQGLAFKNLGDKANARLILEELIRKYPKTSEAKIARDKLKNLK
jgi:tol-pal system protein YbgF